MRFMGTKLANCIVLLFISSGVMASGMVQAPLSELMMVDVNGNRLHFKMANSSIECVEVSLSEVKIEFDCEWMQEIEDPDFQSIRILTQPVGNDWFHTLEIPFFKFRDNDEDEFELVAEFQNGHPEQVFIQHRGAYPHSPIVCIVGTCFDSTDLPK